MPPARSDGRGRGSRPRGCLGGLAGERRHLRRGDLGFPTPPEPVPGPSISLSSRKPPGRQTITIKMMAPYAMEERPCDHRELEAAHDGAVAEPAQDLREHRDDHSPEKGAGHAEHAAEHQHGHLHEHQVS